MNSQTAQLTSLEHRPGLNHTTCPISGECPGQSEGVHVWGFWPDSGIQHKQIVKNMLTGGFASALHWRQKPCFKNKAFIQSQECPWVNSPNPFSVCLRGPGPPTDEPRTDRLEITVLVNPTDIGQVQTVYSGSLEDNKRCRTQSYWCVCVDRQE